LADFDAADSGYCGLNDSWEKNYHVQSFFLYFKQSFLRTDFWREYWDRMRLHEDKEQIILKYEVGLTHEAIRARLFPYAWVPYTKIRNHCLTLGDLFQYSELIRTQPCNATIFMWDRLLADFGYPFLKTELLKVNRKGSRNLVNWMDLIPSDGPVGVSEVLNHLKRVAPNCRI
jgi:hypothetical protein